MKSFPTLEARQQYFRLREQEGAYYEVEIVCGNTTYGLDKIKSATVIPALFQQSGPQIGGVNSTECHIVLEEISNNWPRMAVFEIRERLSSADNQEKSVWISFGTFYTDLRWQDGEFLNITAYDGMLLLEQPWTDKVNIDNDNFPITARRACELLHEALGVEFDSRNVVDNTVHYIGLNTTSTARETLSSIAAGMGGNWYITSDRKLRLVPLVMQPEDVRAIAGIAVSGVSIVGDSTIDNTDNHTFINLGMMVKEIKVGDTVGVVTGVELESPGGTVARAYDGDWYTLKGRCEYADSAVAELCLENVRGYTYSAFSATGALLDPIAEVGDLVKIDGELYPMCVISWNLGKHNSADISAPYEETVDHEYTMLSPSAKALRKAMGYSDEVTRRVYSAIEQTETSIKTIVAETYGKLDEKFYDYSPTADIEKQFESARDYTDQVNEATQSEIKQTKDSLTVALSEIDEADGKIENIVSYIYYGKCNLVKDPQNPSVSEEVTAVVVGKNGTDNKTSVRITNDGIYLCYGDVAVSSWDQNEQLSPKALRVPVGGKLTIGSILFQPRSSGNMSLLWVGNTNGN